MRWARGFDEATGAFRERWVRNGRLEIMKAMAVVVGLVLVVSVGMLVVLLGENHRALEEARTEGEQRRQRADSLSRQLAELKEAQRATEEELKAKAAALERAEASLAEARALREKAPPTAPAAPRPYRARTYLGRQLLGTAWLVPSNLGKDPATGQFAFETVVVLDERMKGAFTVTNVVEKEIVRTSTVNNTYTPPARNPYAYPYYYGAVPWIRPQPERPEPDRPPILPVLPSPPRNGGSPWGSVFVNPVRK